jgi:AcrR family transcriptional regulator
MAKLASEVKMANEHPTGETGAQPQPAGGAITAAPKDIRNAIIDALMELAGERNWEDITISDVAARANVSLSTFRDYFPSKGAVLAGFSRRIDHIVLDGTSDEMAGEPVKERLFDILMRRLDALAPYKLGLECIYDWARRDPLAAAALNREVVNSMRFMLEAAGIESEGPVGAFKLQGLALAWGRVLRAWFQDDDPGLASTMAALDRELTRGSTLVSRAEDLNRLISPLFSLARSVFERRPRRSAHHRERHGESNAEGPAS